MRKNIGIINALIRITVGFTVLAWTTAKLVKRPWRDSYLIMAVLGGMKIGEGILQFCPITALFDRNDEWDDDEGFFDNYLEDEDNQTAGDFIENYLDDDGNEYDMGDHVQQT